MPRVREPNVTPKRPPKSKFWLDRSIYDYCCRTAIRTKYRAAELGVPFGGIDAPFLERLMIDQRARCAISGIAFTPLNGNGGFSSSPYGPALDRIQPALGYVASNVRFVCAIVNAAMGNWGEKYLFELMDILHKRKKGTLYERVTVLIDNTSTTAVQ